jgi:hypothetical protein
VKIGIRNKQLAEILSGVKEGDSVITVGGYALPDKTKITVEAAPAAESESGKDSQGKDNPSKSAPAEKGAAPSQPKDKE